MNIFTSKKSKKNNHFDLNQFENYFQNTDDKKRSPMNSYNPQKSKISEMDSIDKFNFLKNLDFQKVTLEELKDDQKFD